VWVCCISAIIVTSYNGYWSDASDVLQHSGALFFMLLFLKNLYRYALLPNFPISTFSPRSSISI
ncbi:hypothetical protein, partial [Xenorhabdus indica]|uniref:hypothetical protein n=1 Tax=Xenorhabdus indica TaxID=333964 RepID=UPI0021D50995